MSLARSSLLFSVGTIISRFSGLMRDMVVTNLLGATAVNDAFVIAQRIPNLLRDMLAEGALGSSFTKVFTATKEVDSEAAEVLLFQMIYLALLFTSILLGCGIAFAPFLVDVMSLGVKGDYLQDDLTVSLTRFVFPSLSLTVLSAISMGALYQRGKFFLNAIVPVLANFGVIAGGVFGAKFLSKTSVISIDPALFEVYGLAVGTVAGYLLQTLVCLWSIRSSLMKMWRGLIGHFPWSEEVRKVLALMLPAAIAGSAGPINSMVNTNFATSAGEGAVTWLNYAFRLVQLPIGVFGVAVGVYSLPALTRAVMRAGKVVDASVSRVFQDSTMFVVWLLVPCMVYTLLYSHEIIDLIFGHGRYTAKDVDNTARALFIYSLSMLAYGLIKVFSSFYFSIDKTSFAMKVSLSGILVNLLFNFILVDKMGYLGLAITSSVTLILNAFLLFCGVIHSGVRLAIKPVLVECSILVAASLVFEYLVSAYSENNVMQVFSLLKPLIKGMWPLSYDLVGNKVIDLLKLIYGFVLLIFLFGGAAFLYFKRFNPKENV